MEEDIISSEGDNGEMTGTNQSKEYPVPQKIKKSFFERLVMNPTAIGIMIIISLALMWFGVSLFASALPDIAYSYREITWGMQIYSIGTAFLVITLLGLGIGRHDYPQWVRFALILVAGMIIIWGFYLGGAAMSSIAAHYSQ